MEHKPVTRPLTRKVWGGEIQEDRLILKTTLGNEEIPWDQVTQVNVGQVMERINKADLKDETPGGAALKMVPLLGDYLKNKDQQLIKRQDYLVCIIFIREYENPFRLDNSGTNFREMLGCEASLSGLINYTLCIRKIIEHSRRACLDPSAEHFCTLGRKAMATYKNLDSFISYAWAFRNLDNKVQEKKHQFTREEWEQEMKKDGPEFRESLKDKKQ